nr:cation-transporting P-type ATPase [Parachlamydia acanthamoebae]
MKLQEMIHSLKSLFFTTHNTVQETDKKISSILLAYSKVSLEDIYKELESSITGLVQKEAEERLLKYGANEIVHERPPTWYSLMLGNFKNPFVVLMIFWVLFHSFSSNTIL